MRLLEGSIRYPAGRRTLAALCVSGAMVAGCTSTASLPAASPSAAPTSSPASPQETALRKAIAGVVGQADGPPGMIVVLGSSSNGTQLQLRTITAGVADVSSKAAPSAVQQMRLASVSKAYSGAVVLSLVAKGKLELTDTVGKWLKGLPVQWSAVTLTQLLNHTSGIADFSQSSAFRDALVASLQKPAPPRTLMGFAAPALKFRSGSQYEYSNTDNILLALIAEAVTSKSYATVLAEGVLTPFGLEHTSLPNGSAIADPVFRGYALDPPAAPEDVTSQFAAGWTWSSGGVVATASDAVRFMSSYVPGRETNGAAHTAQFQFRPGSSEPTGPGTNAAGLGIFRYQTRCGTVYGHTGNTAGYTQFVAASADGRKAVSVSINSQLTPKTNAALFTKLREIYELATCAALR